MGQAFERFIGMIAKVFTPNTYAKAARVVWKWVIKAPIAYIRAHLWIQIVLITILVIISVLIIYFTWKNRKGYYGVDY